MNFNYAQKLRLKIWKINVGAQKSDGSTLEIFGIVIANFQVKDKISRPGFFQKTFLLADIKFKMILRIFCLKINNANVLFDKKTLR